MTFWFLIALQAAVLAYGLLAGVFLAFSDFIMRALAKTSGAGGPEAMQVINREVFRLIFMALFMGMAPVSLGLAAYGALFVGGVPGGLIVLAGLTYVIGCFGVTVARNVPMNEKLAGMEPHAEHTHTYWHNTYVPRWTFWNSVRTVACVVSMAFLLAAQVWLMRAG